MKLYELKLSYDELLLLDQVEIRKETQDFINNIKLQNSFNFPLQIMEEALFNSLKTGRFSWYYDNIKYCSMCKKACDYKRYSRSSRYHKKGAKDLSKPIWFTGLSLNPGFTRIIGHGDMCTDCEKKYNVIDAICQYILDNDLKIEIMKNKICKTKYVKDKIKLCTKCNKEIAESKMGLLPALMQGSYRGKCPNCGAEERLFDRIFKTTDKFNMVKVE